MDSVTLQCRAEEIARQYLDNLPADYSGRYAALAEPSVIKTLFRAVSAGLNQRDSCAAAGIATDTFQRWMQRADAEPDSAFAALAADLKAARASGKLAHLENIQRHSQKEWTASAWTLERTDPEQFALRKDTDNGPRVLVQIGVRDSDVQVMVSESDVQAALSPTHTQQLARKSTG